jgi:hypothetical protein
MRRNRELGIHLFTGDDVIVSNFFTSAPIAVPVGEAVVVDSVVMEGDKDLLLPPLAAELTSTGQA